MLIEEEQASEREPKFGNAERNEVKRKIVYILGIRVRLAIYLWWEREFK